MEISEEVMQELTRLLETAADLQNQFWSSCRDIEVELGVDIDELSISDLSNWNVDHLVAIAGEWQAATMNSVKLPEKRHHQGQQSMRTNTAAKQ